jgi:hypothetical protein
MPRKALVSLMTARALFWSFQNSGRDAWSCRSLSFCRLAATSKIPPHLFEARLKLRVDRPDFFQHHGRLSSSKSFDDKRASNMPKEARGLKNGNFR